MTPFGWGIAGFPGFGAAGWGVVAYTPPTAIVDLLRTDFSVATPQALTNGQVLDTPSEGVPTGSLFADTGGGSISLTTSAIVFGSPMNFSGGIAQIVPVNFVAGQVLKETLFMDHSSPGPEGATYLQVADSGAIIAQVPTTGFRLYFDWSGINILRYGTGAYTYNDYLGARNGVSWDYMFVLGETSGLILYDKLTASSTWILRWIDEDITFTDAYLVTGFHSGTSEIRSVVIPATLYPEHVTPILQDEFSGSGLVSGRSPDTIDSGKVWQDNNWDGLGTIRTEVVSSYAVGSYLTTTNNADIQIDAEVDDVYIRALGWVGTAQNTDFGLIARQTTGGYNGGIRCRQEHDTNNFVIYGDGLAGSVAWSTAPEATDYEMTLSVVGTAVLATVGGPTGKSLSGVAGGSATGTFCGFQSRWTNGSILTKCQAFKVLRDGVTLDV